MLARITMTAYRSQCNDPSCSPSLIQHPQTSSQKEGPKPEPIRASGWNLWWRLKGLSSICTRVANYCQNSKGCFPPSVPFDILRWTWIGRYPSPHQLFLGQSPSSRQLWGWSLRPVGSDACLKGVYQKGLEHILQWGLICSWSWRGFPFLYPSWGEDVRGPQSHFGPLKRGRQWRLWGIGGEHRGVFVEIVKGKALKKGGRTWGMVKRKRLLHRESYKKKKKSC